MSNDTEWTFEGIAARAQEDEAFRSGLCAAVEVCRAQGHGGDGVPPCPASMAAVYIERLAQGELP